VNGPAKNLLRFYRSCQEMQATCDVQLSIAPFERLGRQSLVGERVSNDFLDAALRLGVQIHCIRESFAFDPRVIWRLRKIVELVNPDVVQTHYSKSHFLVWLSGVWRKRPWIAFHHGHTRSVFRLRIYHGLDRWSLRVANQVATVSEAFARQLVERGLQRERMTILHNAVDLLPLCRDVDPDELRAKKARLGIRPIDQVILAVGRLSKEKAHTDLVAAMVWLRKLNPQVRARLVILGEGSERTRIEQAIQSAGLQEVVTLPGHVSDLTPYYNIADIIVISSLSEGSPNVLLEAMAAGVPIVATAVGGIPEIVKDQEHAILVPPGDPVAMAKAVNALLTTQILGDRLARAARELVAAKYSPEDRARALIQVYENVLTKWRSKQNHR
jgi:glycosyltransferase involved in cell wall biosynthesis